MLVTHIINSLSRGGAETLLVHSIETFRRKFPQVRHHVITLFDGGEYTTKMKSLCDCTSLRMHSLMSVTGWFRLGKLLRAIRPDIVHAHLYESSLMARVMLPRAVKLVATYHTGFHSSASIEYSRKRLLLDRCTFRKNAHVVFVSGPVKRAIFSGLRRSCPHTVLPNFCDPAFAVTYRYREGQGLNLVAVGNLREQKNHAFAINALAGLKDIPVSLDIYGEGNLRASLEKLVNESGAKVRLMGSQTVTSALLSQYDAFVMYSLHEGMPLALIEAMRTGMPCLVGDLPEMRETAEDGALFFSSGSEVDFIRQIKNFIDDRGRLEILSGRALLVAEKYSADRYVDELFRIYTHLAG